jgi:hypothetical protein
MVLGGRLMPSNGKKFVNHGIPPSLQRRCGRPFSDYSGMLTGGFEPLGGTAMTLRTGIDASGNPLGPIASGRFGPASSVLATAEITDFAPLGGAFGFAFGLEPLAPMPEPATLALVGSGLMAAMLRARHRRRDS